MDMGKLFQMATEWDGIIPENEETKMNGTGKVWAQTLATILAGAIPFFSNNDGLTGVALVNFLLMALAAINVGVAGNLTGTVGKYAKAFIAVGTAVGTLLVSLFADHSYALSTTEWIQVILAALGALGVIGFSSPQYNSSPAVLGRAGRDI
jgi:hypothetical protein